MAKFIAIYGSIALIASLIAAIVAGVIKRRDPSYWATVTLLFPPMLVVLFFMAKNKGPRTRRESLDDQEHRQMSNEERY
jgi:ABC-type branched-subunit amino acid transport system permease subunit